MKSKYLLFFLLLPLLFYYSNSSVEHELKLFELGSSIIIDYNNNVINNEVGVSLQFIDVIRDSRCPKGVECVWAGEAELQFIAIKANDSIKFNLISSGQHFGQDTTLFNLHIKLVEVIPYPDASINIAIEDYKAKIIVDKVLE